MKNKKEVQPEVARIMIDVLINNTDSLPTDDLVSGLSESGVPVLSCCVEEIKGNKLKGRLLKQAKETLQMMQEDEGIEEGEE